MESSLIAAFSNVCLAGLVAVPDPGFRAFLAALDSSAARYLFWVSRGRLRHIPAFILCDLRERSAAENRNGREFSDFLFRGVVIAMLN